MSGPGHRDEPEGAVAMWRCVRVTAGGCLMVVSISRTRSLSWGNKCRPTVDMFGEWKQPDGCYECFALHGAQVVVEVIALDTDASKGSDALLKVEEDARWQVDGQSESLLGRPGQTGHPGSVT